ncbi:hypothetical protein KUCAC02_020065 [Chaenocephalus aceratus]|uniref:Uncharacterized protein n=1 Tax=Chaenocephalus aceratus TaxID=36190 RepID=A0ACB9VQZ7_CHAAC|nr:hypothetical protein KUCAC02_020065 [Chaenocephalus aceratus]
MGISVVLGLMLAASVTPVFAAAQPGIIESLLLATHQRPWLWGVYVFTVGLPAVLFISFMWPDKRFGPPDQEYYYKKSDDTQPDDPEFSKQTDAVDIKGTADRARGRRRDTHGNTRKGDLDLKVEKEDIISSKSADYRVLDFIGEGVFGKVAKCVNLKTSETIAIKIHKDRKDQVKEVRMLEIIRKLDPEKNNLIRFIDNFFFRDVSCLAFEMLDQSLLDFLRNRRKAWRLNEIRPITQQLLVAFKALKSIGVIHSDLKLGNIMFVNHQNQPFRIKLIDFGLAIPSSEVEIGTEKQPLQYRAPEVTLGLPISEAIDMWSLGCIIAVMYFYARFFPVSSQYCSMKVICHKIGQPGDHLLNAGKFTSNYFIRELKKNSPEWRFKTRKEYKEGTGVEPDISKCVLDQYSSLDKAIVDCAKERGRVQLKDRMVFVQLLKRLLDLDANSRITPEQALTHSFVTMDHLEEDLDCSPYVADAVRWMTICRLDHSDASDVPVNNHETESSGGEKDMDISCNADARPDGFCQDPPITSCRKSSQKEQPNSNLEKSNIDTTHNKSTPNSNDGAAAAITPTDQGDVDKTCTGLPKRLNVFKRMRRRVVSFCRRVDTSNADARPDVFCQDPPITSETFQVEKEDIISSKSADYRVLDFIGEGAFGKVAKCVNLKTSETIAIKIHKDREDQVEEVRMLEIIRKLDPEKNNLIRFIDNFFFRDVSCLAFEMLDQSLYDFMMNRQKAYRLNEIRPITQQLLVAFKALKSIGVIHSDLKHDNIMFVNHQNQPFRIKLIDFGEAIPSSEVEIGTEKQPLLYRAPEVTLGLPISEAIDMWSLGCIIAEMYFYAYLFPDSSQYCSMKVICHKIGQPGDHLLNAGKFTSNYFIRELKKNSPEWRFKTRKEYKEGTGVKPDISLCLLDQYSSLDKAIEDCAKEKGRVQLKDRMVFVQLLKRLLDLDANSRITPEQALTHSFVTMDHLEEDLDCSPYVADAVRWMTICRLDHSDASDVPVNNHETESSGGEKDMDISCNADARPDGFCQDPPITSCRKSSQKEQPNSNLEKSNIDTTHNKSTPNSNDGAAAAITPTDQGDVDKTCTGLPKRLNVFKRMRRRVVSFCRRVDTSNADARPDVFCQDPPITSETFQVEKENIISSKSADYRVLDFIGEGVFGKVAKCVNLKTSETIAIKIHKDSEDQVKEVRMLEIIRKLDPEKNNLIRFIDNFFFRDVSCLAFEMLDQSLYDFMMNRQKAYRLNEIRPITQQLLVAFKALKSIGVIHSDLKHDNIMFVNHQNQPFRIKLIDFGEAIPSSEVEIGTEKQPLLYRAPEVTLGLPISEAIDMWSLGCIIAEMYFYAYLFPDSSQYCSMKVICHKIGQPGDHLLNAGKFTSNYFIRELKKNSPEWRFKTRKEYKEGTGVKPDISLCLLDQYSSLDKAIEDCAKEKGRVQLKDRMVFVQLLKRLLDLDANSRITPEQALTHSFVTMDHLEEDLDCSPYVADAVRWMTICRLDHSDASDVPVNNHETESSGGEKDMDISCNADARPDGFCQDPPITSCRKSSQKEQPNSNLEKSNIDTTHNKSTPNSNDGAAAAITPTDQGDVDKTCTGLPKRLNVFQRMRRRVVSFCRRFKK